MSIINPVMFIGEAVLGGVPGAPLQTDGNGLLASGLNSIEVSATASTTAPTGTDALMNTMTVSPTAGTYIAIFSTDITSGTSGAAISVSLYIGGVQDASSLRKIIPFSGGTLTSGSGRGVMAINRTVTVTTGQAVEIRWSTSTAGPTAASRVLTLLRIL